MSIILFGPFIQKSWQMTDTENSSHQMEELGGFKLGDRFEFEFSIDNVAQHCFAELSGDHNPIHLDAEYAKRCVLATGKNQWVNERTNNDTLRAWNGNPYLMFASSGPMLAQNLCEIGCVHFPLPIGS